MPQPAPFERCTGPMLCACDGDPGGRPGLRRKLCYTLAGCRVWPEAHRVILGGQRLWVVTVDGDTVRLLTHQGDVEEHSVEEVRAAEIDRTPWPCPACGRAGCLEPTGARCGWTAPTPSPSTPPRAAQGSLF